MGLAHWERCVVDNCIAMLSKATVEARAEAAELLRPVLTGQSPIDPGASPEPGHLDYCMKLYAPRPGGCMCEEVIRRGQA